MPKEPKVKLSRLAEECKRLQATARTCRLTAVHIRRLDHEFQRKLHASGQFEPRAKA